MQRGGYSAAAPSIVGGGAKSQRGSAGGQTARSVKSTRTGYSKSRMSKADPYEHYEPEMFDGLIETTEKEMTSYFKIMK